MTKKKDVLECCRSWNTPLNEVDNFLQAWLTHDHSQDRLDVYYQLRQWGEDYSYWDIETVIELVCMVWEKVQKYEKENPGKILRTLKEAEDTFNIFYELALK